MIFYFLIISIALLFGLSLVFSNRAFNKLIKSYIIYVVFLLYPLLASFTPSIEIGALSLNPRRLFYLPSLIFILVIIIRNPSRIRLNRFVFFIGLYYLYSIVNRMFNGHFIASEFTNIVFILSLIFLIVLIDFEYIDRKRFLGAITALSVFTVAVSLYQYFISPDFYNPIYKDLEDETIFMYESRIISIFKGLSFSEGTIGLVFLSMIVLFQNLKKTSVFYSLLFTMLLISVFLTLTRSAWILAFLGFLFFIYNKNRSRVVASLIILVIILSLVYIIFFPTFETTSIYQDRVLAESYLGRFQSIQIYFKEFFGKNLLFGYGMGSMESGLFYKYGRHTTHNGFLEILFQDGLIGFGLYVAALYYLYRITNNYYRTSGNILFNLLLVLIIIANFSSIENDYNNIAYIIFLYYLFLSVSIENKLAFQKLQDNS